MVVHQVVVGQIFPVVTIMAMIKDLSDNMVDSNDIKEENHRNKKNLSASRASLLSTTFLLSFLAFSLKLATSLGVNIFVKSNVLRIQILVYTPVIKS